MVCIKRTRTSKKQKGKHVCTTKNKGDDMIVRERHSTQMSACFVSKMTDKRTSFADQLHSLQLSRAAHHIVAPVPTQLTRSKFSVVLQGRAPTAVKHSGLRVVWPRKTKRQYTSKKQKGKHACTKKNKGDDMIVRERHSTQMSACFVSKMTTNGPASTTPPV